jgi:hypothetical protein
VRYWPNPAHKEETSEAGPPAWRPHKEKCPRDITIGEREELLNASIPVNAADPRSRRFAIRRTASGEVQLFDVKFTRDVEGVPEFHGHPASRVDRGVLKQMRDNGDLKPPEYNRLRKDLPGC